MMFQEASDQASEDKKSETTEGSKSEAKEGKPVKPTKTLYIQMFQLQTVFLHDANLI